MILRALFWSMAFAVSLMAGEEINSPLAKGSKVRYLDLLRLVCPDLKVKDDDPAAAVATRRIGIRELGTNDTPAQVEEEEIAITAVALLTTGPRALVTFVANAATSEQKRNLALFDLSAAPKLLDVVSVSGFPDDVGNLDSALTLNETTDAYVFAAFHMNSSQGYNGYTILFLHGNRFEEIVSLGLLSQNAFGDAESFEESADFSTVPDPGHAYRSVVIKATLKHLADPPESEHRPRRRPYTRLYTAVYRWDAAAGKFVTNSREIELLRAFNKKNY
jgi:hypothetical protein